MDGKGGEFKNGSSVVRHTMMAICRREGGEWRGVIMTEFSELQMNTCGSFNDVQLAGENKKNNYRSFVY